MRKLLRHGDGTAAVEFAFVVPILLTLLLGVYEVGNAIIVYMKVIDAADVVSDLAAQYQTVTSTDFDNFYTAGKLVMQPDTGNGLAVAVASVTFDPNTGNPSVAWQITRGGAGTMPDAANASVGLGSKGDSVIVARATYTYSSLLKYVLPNNLTISSRVISRPRYVNTIPCTAPCS